MADELNNIDNELIKINPEADENELVLRFEEDTDRTLYSAQSERVMISHISYYGNVVLTRVRDAFKMFFLRFANKFFLRLWGELLDCPIIGAKQAYDVLEVETYEAYSSDKTLPKGSKIYTKDGEYIFTTDEDLIIPAGSTTARVNITSELAGSKLNNYAAGEINELVENYEYIKSVKNINGANGGADEEDTEHYRQRLYLAPGRFSVAGPELAYKFFAMSADTSICDVAVLTPDTPASVEINQTTYEFKENSIDNDLFSADIDYTTGTININAKTPLNGLKVVIPPVFTVILYILTESGIANENIIEAVKKSLSEKEKRPMLDNMLVYSAKKIDYELELDVVLSEEADEETVKKLVKEALDSYVSEIKSKLNTAIEPEHIIRLAGNIEGVYKARPKKMETMPAYADSFYNIIINKINYTRL